MAENGPSSLTPEMLAIRYQSIPLRLLNQAFQHAAAYIEIREDLTNSYPFNSDNGDLDSDDDLEILITGASEASGPSIKRDDKPTRAIGLALLCHAIVSKASNLAFAQVNVEVPEDESPEKAKALRLEKSSRLFRMSLDFDNKVIRWAVGLGKCGGEEQLMECKKKVWGRLDMIEVRVELTSENTEWVVEALNMDYGLWQAAYFEDSE